MVRSSTTSSELTAAEHRAHRAARQREMYRRRRLAVSGLALILIGVLTLGVQGAQALISGLTAPESATSVRATDETRPLAAADTPVHLEIESAGINVPISGAGLDEDGEIDPPQGEVTWYTGHGRVSPGDLGTAVIAGHVSYDREPDTFAELSKVTEGDRVTITFGDGVRLETEIVSTHLITTDELQDSDLVWGDQRTKRRIAIVTCDEALGFGEDGHRKGNFVAIAELG